MFNASVTLTKYGVRHSWLRVYEVKDQVTVLVYDKNYRRYVEQSTHTLMLDLVRTDHRRIIDLGV